MTRSPSPTDDTHSPDSAEAAHHRHRRQAWSLQGVGVLAACIGLAGFWLTYQEPRAALTSVQREILGVAASDFTASFVVAGRDRFYAEGLSDPIYGAEGRIVGWRYRGRADADGMNTDTIIYVQVVNDEVTMIAVPRDLYLESWRTRVNSVYQLQGAEGLRRTVEDVLGLPVDYYVVINLDVFTHVVDALGGVRVNVPYDMRYRDIAGGLDINLRQGLQVLDGKGAADFVRFRQTARGDFDRLDRLKTLAYASLARIRELNVRAVAVLPELVDSLFRDVETNATPTVATSLLSRLARLEIRAATLPTVEIEGDSRLYVDRGAVQSFLAATFGGTARAATEAPDVVLHVVNRSGLEGLEGRYRDRLVAMGVPAERIVVSTASLDPSPSRVIATTSHWHDADYYSSLLSLGKQTIDRLPAVQGRTVGVQLVLGQDALVPGPDFTVLAALAAAAPENP
jgi:polyisoprenyl-teichoic acid--peptidoglycan teichoic acid transferase